MPALRTWWGGACEDSPPSSPVVLVNRSQPNRRDCSMRFIGCQLLLERSGPIGLFSWSCERRTPWRLRERYGWG
jgi:hypothetical protein